MLLSSFISDKNNNTITSSTKGCILDYTCEDTGYITYSYKITQISCRQWDDTIEEWTTDNCEVMLYLSL